MGRAKLSLAALIFAIAVAAQPSRQPTSTSDVAFEPVQCNGGTLQCCSAVQAVEDMNKGNQGALKLVGVDVPRLEGFVGFGCQPVNGLAPEPCEKKQTQACCAQPDINGSMATGCEAL